MKQGERVEAKDVGGQDVWLQAGNGWVAAKIGGEYYLRRVV